MNESGSTLPPARGTGFVTGPTSAQQAQRGWGTDALRAHAPGRAESGLRVPARVLATCAPCRSSEASGRLMNWSPIASAVRRSIVCGRRRQRRRCPGARPGRLERRPARRAQPRRQTPCDECLPPSAVQQRRSKVRPARSSVSACESRSRRLHAPPICSPPPPAWPSAIAPRLRAGVRSKAPHRLRGRSRCLLVATRAMHAWTPDTGGQGGSLRERCEAGGGAGAAGTTQRSERLSGAHEA